MELLVKYPLTVSPVEMDGIIDHAGWYNATNYFIGTTSCLVQSSLDLGVQRLWLFVLDTCLTHLVLGVLLSVWV